MKLPHPDDLPESFFLEDADEAPSSLGGHEIGETCKCEPTVETLDDGRKVEKHNTRKS